MDLGYFQYGSPLHLQKLFYFLVMVLGYFSAFTYLLIYNIAQQK